MVSGHRRPRFEGRLGQVLVEGGFLTADQLLEAEQLMMKEGKRLTSVLQEKGWTSKDTLTTVLSFHLKVPVADPRQVEVDPEAVRLVPEALATEANILPIATDRDGTLRVLMEDPGDFDTINKLATLTGRQIKAVLPIGDGLDELIKRNYSAGADLTGAIDMATRIGAGGTAIEQFPRETSQDQDTFSPRRRRQHIRGQHREPDSCRGGDQTHLWFRDHHQ